VLFTVEDAEACFDNHLRRMERTDAPDRPDWLHVIGETAEPVL